MSIAGDDARIRGMRGGGSRASIVIKADPEEEDVDGSPAVHCHAQEEEDDHQGGGAHSGVGGRMVAASDREMSQCYELLIATHPIHILMPNPSPPIGPPNPQHGERGKMRTCISPFPGPPSPFFFSCASKYTLYPH